MALPKGSFPTYNLVIPSSKQNIKYRPFLVKERTSLLIANESDDERVMISTLVDVITNCTFNEVNVNTLTLFDLEYIFAKLRAVSSSEISTTILKCDDCPEDNEEAQVIYNIDLNALDVTFPEGVSNTIPLYDNVGIVLNYPSFNTILDIKTDSEIELLMDIISKSVKYIYEGDEIHNAVDYSVEDIKEFLGTLTEQHLEQIAKFFIVQPELKLDVQYTCPVCNKEHNKTIKGLKNFFSSSSQTKKQ